MSTSRNTKRLSQFLALAIGLIFLGLAVQPIVDYIRSGSLEFTLRHSSVTGPVAYFQVLVCIVIGTGLTFSAIRNLRSSV